MERSDACMQLKRVGWVSIEGLEQLKFIELWSN